MFEDSQSQEEEILQEKNQNQINKRNLFSDSEDDENDIKDDNQINKNKYYNNQTSDDESDVDDSNQEDFIFNQFQEANQLGEVEKRKLLLEQLQINQKNNEQDYIEQEKKNDFLQEIIQNNRQEYEKIKEENPNLVREEDILERILNKRKYEMKQLTNKLRQDPEQYLNFVKSYILLDIIRQHYIVFYSQNDYFNYDSPYLNVDEILENQALVISRIPNQDLSFLENLVNEFRLEKQRNQEKNGKNKLFDNKNNQQNKDRKKMYSEKNQGKPNFIQIISTIMFHFKKSFAYKIKAEQREFRENLLDDQNNYFGYLQMLQIFMIICNYFKIKYRLNYIQDLSLLDINQKFDLTGNSKIKQFMNKKNKITKKAIGGSDSDDNFIQRKRIKGKKGQSLSTMMEQVIFSNNTKKDKMHQNQRQLIKEKSRGSKNLSGNLSKLKTNVMDLQNLSFSSSDEQNITRQKSIQLEKNGNLCEKNANQLQNNEEESTKKEYIADKLEEFKFQGKRRPTFQRNRVVGKSSIISKDSSDLKKSDNQNSDTKKISFNNPNDDKNNGNLLNLKNQNDNKIVQNQNDIEKNKEDQRNQISAENLQNMVFKGKDQQKQQNTILTESITVKEEKFNLINNNKYNKQDQKGIYDGDKNMVSFSDYYNQQDMKHWIDIWDEDSENWVQVDPVGQKFLNENSIKEKLQNTPVLFIFSFLKMSLCESQEIEKQLNALQDEKNLSVQNKEKYLNRINQKKKIGKEQIKDYYKQRILSNILVEDISSLYSDNYLKLHASRKNFRIYEWWQNLNFEICGYSGLSEFFESEFRKCYEKLKKNIQDKEQKCIPQNPYLFRFSDYYIIKSQVKKYKMLKPWAKPIADLKYQDEEIYNKNDVIELNGKMRWARLCRKVKENEEPLKQVSSIMGNGRMADLWALWQTYYDKPKLNLDGSLPKNDYGNYEIHNGVPLPKDVVYINLPYLPRILKQQNIEYVEAVIGFERNRGMSHVVKQGVIAHKKDEEIIRQLFKDNIKEIEQKKIDSVKNGLFQIWRKLFKAIILKKEISDKYDKIEK